MERPASLSIHLLGSPRVERDGVAVPPPRGKKVWGLLAYLALADRAPSRQELVDLLFGDAEDPFGVLRWNLSELRRLLGSADAVRGREAVTLSLPEGSLLDVRALVSGGSQDPPDPDSLGRELLEGIEIASSPGFDGWLLAQRRYLRAAARAHLRERALRRLAAGDAWQAVALATRLVSLDPFDEEGHELLLRSFAATGDRGAVARQLAASEELFRRELGARPGPAVYRAAVPPENREPSPGPQGPAAWRALLDSGEAAVGAGAVDVGIETLRRAAAGAAESGDFELQARALLALGSALVHAAKSRDEEGAAALHQALVSAGHSGTPAVQAAAYRELGYVELLRGEYSTALATLVTAEQSADEDPLELARIRAIRGVCLADVGSHLAAQVELLDSVRLAEAGGHRKQLSWSLALLGRTHLLLNDLEPAEAALDRSLQLATGLRWMAFIPCPESFLGEVWLRQGQLDRAEAAFDHALTLGCEVDDACWEAYAVRGQGLLHAARGDLAGAFTLLQDSTTRCLRQRDTFLWIRGYTLDALCAVAVAAGRDEANRLIDDLAALSGRAGMRELTVRSYLHRRDLGDRSALRAAQTLATGLENPHLDSLLAGGQTSLLDELLGRTPVPSLP